MRGVYAVKALRFSTALSVLKDEFLRSRDYPKCPPTSQLFHRFRQLGYYCIRLVTVTMKFIELMMLPLSLMELLKYDDCVFHHY